MPVCNPINVLVYLAFTVVLAIGGVLIDSALKWNRDRIFQGEMRRRFVARENSLL